MRKVRDLQDSEQLLLFLQEVDKGHEITSDEIQSLAEIEELSLHLWDSSILPNSIKYLVNLKDLTFSCREAPNLEVLSGLVNLEKLFLFSTENTSIIGLSGLVNLKNLMLFCPAITEIQGLGELINLQELYLNTGELTQIEGVDRLVNLHQLDLDVSPQANLDAIGELENLQGLAIETSQHIRLDKFEKLSKLQHLSFRHTLSVDLRGLKKFTNLKGINLYHTKVENIHELVELSNLETLNLSDTDITHIDDLERLSCLRKINISNTGLRDWDSICRLTQLESLVVSDREITNLEGLSALVSLTSLSLTGTNITSLKGVEGLIKLKEISLQNTGINSLKALNRMSDLECLDVSHSCVDSLDGINRLGNLQRIDLSYSKITTIPKWIGTLKKLVFLDLSGLALHSIPRGLNQLKLPYSFSDSYRYNGDNDIRLRGTTLATQPISLFEQPRELIDAYFAEKQIPVNEAKVIFLGDGGVGKTHTIRRIHNNGEQGEYNTKTTPGINITNFKAGQGNQAFMIHFWDFGGQEIMHAMHRCFLTNRTCYVVVLSNRWDLDRQARYWLKNIDSFAKGAAVILAINKWDDIRECAIDTSRLHNEYTNLVDVIFYSAKNSDKAEFQRLTQAIIEQAQKLDSCSMKLPAHWAAIRKGILERAENQPYLDKEEYYQLCTDNGLESENIRMWLLEWFNDLGVCFSYHHNAKEKSELAAYKVLNPAWLTNAIYKIINFGKDYAEKGIINKKSILDLLRSPEGGVLQGVTYNAQERDYVLEVMRKFNLSYPISSRSEFVPALCDPETPEALHPDVCAYKQHVAYKLEYKYLPDSVVHQLMIRCYKNLNPDTLWRKGLRIDFDSFDLHAVVDMGGTDSSLRIDVYAGGNIPSWELLQSLRKDLVEINQRLNLEAKDYIIVTGDKGESDVLVDMLLEMKEQGDSSIPVYNEIDGLKRYSVNELLGATFGRENVEAALKQVRDGEGKMQDIIHSITYQNCSFYDSHDRYNTSQMNNEVLNLIRILVQGEHDTNQKLIGCLIDSLKSANGNAEAQKLGNEMEKDRKEKKNPMKRFKEFVGDAAEITTKGKIIATALIPVVTKLVEIAPEIADTLQTVFSR